MLKSAVTEQEILNVLAWPHIAALTIPSFRKDLAKRLATAELIATTKRIAARRDPTQFPASGTRRRRAGSTAHSGRSAPLPAGLRRSMGLRGPWITSLLDWTELHQSELRDNWTPAQQRKPIKNIRPMESDVMSWCRGRRPALTCSKSPRVARADRAEPHARRADHGAV